jgi:hypothetical protein
MFSITDTKSVAPLKAKSHFKSFINHYIHLKDNIFSVLLRFVFVVFNLRINDTNKRSKLPENKNIIF